MCSNQRNECRLSQLACEYIFIGHRCFSDLARLFTKSTQELLHKRFAAIANGQQQILMHVLDVGEQHIGPVASVSIPPSLADGSETHPMHGYRIGVSWDWFNDATPEVIDCCKSALNVLCAKGAEVGLSGLLTHCAFTRVMQFPVLFLVHTTCVSAVWHSIFVSTHLESTCPCELMV